MPATRSAQCGAGQQCACCLPSASQGDVESEHEHERQLPGATSLHGDKQLDAQQATMETHNLGGY